MRRPHYHYAWPHGRPCENPQCPEWLVEFFHAPDEPCTCAPVRTSPEPTR